MSGVRLTWRECWQHRLILKGYRPKYAVLEWICFLVILVMGYMGADERANLFLDPVAHLYYANSARSIYGICLAYLIFKMLSVPPDQPLGCRPTALMRAVLSWDFWVPIATLSYSLYLFHPATINLMEYLNLLGPLIPKTLDVGAVLTYWICFLPVCLLITSIVATLTFICVEKPGIDARKVYKHKVEIA